MAAVSVKRSIEYMTGLMSESIQEHLFQFGAILPA